MSNSRMRRRSLMGRRGVVACVAMLLAGLATAAQAVPYVPGNDWSYMELAAPPQQLGPGSDYPGMWEYVYDVQGGSHSWTRYARISGFNADLIANQHTATTGEDRDGDGDILDYGVWQRWDSHSVGGYAPWGYFRENSIYPSYWNGSEWQLGGIEVGGGNWPGQNSAFAINNTWHTGDEYLVSQTEICPSFCTFDSHNNFRRWPGLVKDYDASPGGDTLEFDSFVHATTGWGWDNNTLELTFRVVHPNAPGSITWSTFHNDSDWVEGTITGPSPGSPCIVGDANCDGYVDIANDILPGFTNFTGPGSFGKTRVQGDVHGDGTGATPTNDPHDGDVDVSDLLTMFGAFTGPPPDQAGGLAASEAGDPGTPDLIYDSATGEVVLDVDGSGIIGYVLKSAGGMIAGNHTPILAGVSTSTVNEISEAAFASSVGANSIGLVFPAGMDLAALTAFLTTNDVSTSLGAPVVPFELVVLGGVTIPEPTTVVLAIFGLAGMGLVAYRRRRS